MFTLNTKSLQGKMIIAFMFMGLIVLSVALIGLQISNQLGGYVYKLGNQNLPNLVSLWMINEGQTQIESSERALMNEHLNQQQRQIEVTRIESAWKQIDEGFKMYESTMHTPEEDKIYQDFTKAWDSWKQGHKKFMILNVAFEQNLVINPYERALMLSRQNQPESSAEMVRAMMGIKLLKDLIKQSFENRAPFEEATAFLIKDIQLNQKMASEIRQEASQSLTKSKIWVLIGLIIGPLTAVGFGLYFSAITQKNLSTLIQRMQKSGITITTSATQLAASGKELEATLNEQAASTNEVAATAREIAATSEQLVKTMHNVQGTSESTATSAGESQKDLMHMENTMRKLANATGTISGKLTIISEKANNINSIITTITKVADQTNLLSLNAAIEAEKAGEYGTGFAVVAREIRRLADQTAVATLDIESMVREMQGAVSTGVMEMDKFSKEVEKGVTDVQNIGNKLESIIDKVQSITPKFQEVGEGMGAQSQGAQQISEAMLQLIEAASQTMGSLREINSAIEQLNFVSQSLRQEILNFREIANFKDS